jgi:uncharacterized membrane protein YccC
MAATSRGALAELIRSAARLDRTQSDPIVSARNAVGVVLPLALGAATGHPAYGVAATIGAMQTAFADRPGPYRLRILRMLVTAGAAGITSWLATLFSHRDGASAALILVIAFGAGLLLATGPSGSQVGVAATAAALVLGHNPQSASAAAGVGVLVFAGGAMQSLLAIAAWPLGRHSPERRALAGLYAEMAGMARRPSSTAEGPPLGVTLATVRQTLYGLGHDHGPSVEAYRVLLDEAERIRGEVLALSGLIERLTGEGATASAASLRTALDASGVVLDEISRALLTGRDVDVALLGPARNAIQAAHSILQPGPASPTSPDLTPATQRLAARRLRSLSGQLRAAVDTARTGAGEGRQEEPGASVTDGPAARLRDPFAVVRANLSLDSAVLRHAARLAILVASVDLITRLLGFGRGYWIALTILVVLRPDFASTFQRAAMRITGTVIGLLLATVLVHWIPLGLAVPIILVGLFFFGMRFAGPGNLLLSAMSLSALVVVLLSIAGQPPHLTVLPRAVDTVIGGALALMAVLLGPVWERNLLPVRIGDLLADYRGYLLAVTDPKTSAGSLQRARVRARLARSNAQASVDRARSDPVSGQAAIAVADAALAHTHRFVHAVMNLEAELPAGERLPQLVQLLDAAAVVLDLCQVAVHDVRPPRSVPRLRPLQSMLVEVLERDPHKGGATLTVAAIEDSTDRIANSLDTLAYELKRQLGARTTNVEV